MNRKLLEEKAAGCLMKAASLIILSVLALILATILLKGLPALNLDMITKTPRGGFYLGKEGGILNAIVGSLYLAGGATLLSLLLSLPIVLYLNVFAGKRSYLAAFTRFSLDVLWGVPSIVYGAFGFTIMLFLGLRASLLGGMIAVTLLVLPIMSRTMDEVMRMVPAELLDASYALGATRVETAFKVMTR
ncbi:MAG TPA: ABC transporter permease subunit, partial [bacterium]|nr:ABC transporter permease subunit [bacterium]